MSDDNQAREAALQQQGLAVLRDLLAQVEGLETYTLDTGGLTMVLFVRLLSGGILGITRGSLPTDLQSPDGWLVCYYDSEQGITDEASLLRDNATFAELLELFVLFAPDRPFPAFLFPDLEG